MDNDSYALIQYTDYRRKGFKYVCTVTCKYRHSKCESTYTLGFFEYYTILLIHGKDRLDKMIEQNVERTKGLVTQHWEMEDLKYRMSLGGK